MSLYRRLIQPLFSVIYGHAELYVCVSGADVALCCSRQLHTEIAKEPVYDNNVSLRLFSR